MDSTQFKFWLFDKELISLLEVARGLDMLDAMEFQNDKAFNAYLGIPYKWTRYIASLVFKQARGIQGGHLEDILTEVIRRIITDLDNGQKKTGHNALWPAVETIKERYKGQPEAMQAMATEMQKLIAHTVKYRASDEIRKLRRDRTRQVQFGQGVDDEQLGLLANIKGRDEQPGDQAESESLEHMVIKELDTMIQTATANHETKLAHRLELAKMVATDRMSGMVMAELAAKHNIKQSQLESILRDIEAAVTQMGGGMLADKAKMLQKRRVGQ